MIKQDIKLAADCLVFSRSTNSIQILLVTRKNEPFKGMWSIPGGFVEDDEELDAAAMRELKEETGMQLERMHQLYTFGGVDRDPRFRTVSVAHYAIVDLNDHTGIKAGDDAKQLQWFDVKNLPPLAFDHKEEIARAMQKIKELQ